MPHADKPTKTSTEIPPETKIRYDSSKDKPTQLESLNTPTHGIRR